MIQMRISPPELMIVRWFSIHKTAVLDDNVVNAHKQTGSR